MEVIKSSRIGFCFGVRRAIDILEKLVRERGRVESLGEVVHNEQVIQRLNQLGVRIARDIDDIQGKTIVLGAHGTSPETDEILRERGIEIIDTTCPFVIRAQKAAKRLADEQYFVIVFGDAGHVEVKGILGWAGNRGLATTSIDKLASISGIPLLVGILSQTTQIPAMFSSFVREAFNVLYRKDSEIRIIDTICHDIRDRQEAALSLAQKVDLMLVVGSLHSANTRHLTELCSGITVTYQVTSSQELKSEWFKGIKKVGITGGASTSENTIQEVYNRLTEIISV